MWWQYYYCMYSALNQKYCSLCIWGSDVSVNGLKSLKKEGDWTSLSLWIVFSLFIQDTSADTERSRYLTPMGVVLFEGGRWSTVDHAHRYIMVCDLLLI